MQFTSLAVCLRAISWSQVYRRTNQHRNKNLNMNQQLGMGKNKLRMVLGCKRKIKDLILQ